jgi:hypothetical protein
MRRIAVILGLLVLSVWAQPAYADDGGSYSLIGPSDVCETYEFSGEF